MIQYIMFVFSCQTVNNILYRLPTENNVYCPKNIHTMMLKLETSLKHVRQKTLLTLFADEVSDRTP